MIHVNVRGLIVRKVENEIQVVIQMRKRKDEPEMYELPGGRLNEYEKVADGLKREIKEETGLDMTIIYNEKESLITTGSIFSVECTKPFAAYQTIEGPVDSFGIYFICEAEGTLLNEGDDTTDIHWASIEEIRSIVEEHKFSEIDLPALLMFLKDEIGYVYEG